MICKKPFKGFGCGQCVPCRITRRRLWTHRILLESLKHNDNCFVTLTYNNETLPQNGSLDPDATQKWLKRLRKRLSEDIFPKKIRYFLVGEYGDETQRPHYHLALFGYPPCIFGRSTYTSSRKNCCGNCDLIRDTWGLGNIVVGTLERESAQYVAGYVLKKLTNPDNPWVQKILQGRHPEYARMSRKPGLGASAMHDVALALTTHSGAESILREGDVAHTLQHGTKPQPLGRYLRRILRKTIGFYHEDAQPGWTQQAQEKMRLLQKAFESDPKNDPKNFWKQQKIERLQKVKQIETRSKIHSKKGSL